MCETGGVQGAKDAIFGVWPAVWLLVWLAVWQLAVFPDGRFREIATAFLKKRRLLSI